MLRVHYRDMSAATRNVRFGSQADVSQCNRHVRFTPQ